MYILEGTEGVYAKSNLALDLDELFGESQDSSKKEKEKPEKKDKDGRNANKAKDGAS